MTALYAGFSAARRAYLSPGDVGHDKAFSGTQNSYSTAWAYYRGQMFDGAGTGFLDYYSGYLTRYGLYKHTRLLYNPVPAIVDFYIDHIYPGSDPEILDDGTILVTPVLDGTDDDLKIALAQLDQWGNWLPEAHKLVRYAANVGSCLTEVVDDLGREKILHEHIWPSFVVDLDLDKQGNVKLFKYEHKVFDRVKNLHYLYGKQIDEDSIREYKDGKPFDYGEGAGRDNPYGFVPAVWIKHEDDGGENGVPPITSYAPIDEINSLASHTHDAIHKDIEASKLISVKGGMLPIMGASGSVTGQGGQLTAYDTRRDRMILKSEEGASVHDLGSVLDLAKADPSIDRQLSSFENHYAELQATEILKNKSQLAFNTLVRLLGPAQAKLDRAAPNYNQQVIKLKQMQIAIAGYRVGNGWTKRDAQQEKFGQFGLASYARGELNFGLKRALLVQETEMEKEELRAKRVETAQAADGLFDHESRLAWIEPDEKTRKEIMRRLTSVDVIPEVVQ